MKEEDAECGESVEGIEVAELKYTTAPFDLAAYERLCHDIDYDPDRIWYLRSFWERGTLRKQYLVADDAYLVNVPPIYVMDRYRYYLFCFRDVCCEVSRKHDVSAVIGVSVIGGGQAVLPAGYETALLTALTAFHRQVRVSTLEVVEPRIEWHHLPLNGAWRRTAGDPAVEELVRRPRPDKVWPAGANRRVRMNRKLAEWSTALLIYGFIFFAFWIAYF
ncbi:hypothetical protein [Roseateles noduli]|uniref:hypothetical protein n=1 Tax=Roseateles noduli TaxID=2052484 RepID=UPI003D648167